jgi:hypothetical protein
MSSGSGTDTAYAGNGWEFFGACTTLFMSAWGRTGMKFSDFAVVYLVPNTTPCCDNINVLQILSL